MERTNKITETLNPKTRKNRTLMEFKSDITLSADVFEIPTEASTEEDNTNQLYFESLTGLTWNADRKRTKKEIETIQESDHFLIFENAMGSEKPGCMEKRYILSVEDTKNARLKEFERS